MHKIKPKVKDNKNSSEVFAAIIVKNIYFIFYNSNINYIWRKNLYILN